MSDFRECPTCHRYAWLATHTCPPVWKWNCPDLDDEWRPIHALSAEDAATEAAEVLDSDHWETLPIASGRAEATIRIRCGNAKAETFHVSGETLPHYRAHRQPDDAGSGR